MKIEIFEPSLCCPTGLCGPEPDKSLIDLQNTIQILGKASVKVNRYAINQAPSEFMRNAEVRDFIIKSGPGELPVTLLDGKIIKTGNYASLDELAVHIPEIKNLKPDQKILGIFS
ncbi:MAG: arsenite efflux transporter metallochaperone ArsD [Bacteroidales bacterium]|nr:arsenite efflux transporter metallochaperone ArsD [Bacteroidales bacterium]